MVRVMIDGEERDATPGEAAAMVVAPGPAGGGVPVAVSNAQLRLAMMDLPGKTPASTLFDDFDTAMLATQRGAKSPRQLFMRWNHANPIVRNGPVARALEAAPFNLTAAQVDQLFIAAAAHVP